MEAYRHCSHNGLTAPEEDGCITPAVSCDTQTLDQRCTTLFSPSPRLACKQASFDMGNLEGVQKGPGRSSVSPGFSSNGLD